MDLVLELKVCCGIAHFAIHLRVFLRFFVVLACHIYSVEAHKVFETTLIIVPKGVYQQGD